MSEQSTNSWVVAWLMLLSATALIGCGGADAAQNDKPVPSANPTTLDSYPPMAAGAAPGASPQVRALAASLGAGINFGDMLDAPTEGAWGLKVEDEFIKLVGTTGFSRHVRLPVRWSNHASVDAAAVIDAEFFKRVDFVVDALLATGSTVMLNMHHYRQLDGDALDSGERAVDPSVLKLRFLAMWEQIAQRYASRNDRLIFELYNEPHGAQESSWNDMASRAVRVIRKSNPQRALVIGPTVWNSATALEKLVLPPDPNLILTVHHYEPFNFTHQGAPWVQPVKPLGVDCCDASQSALITGLLDTAAKQAVRLGYPVFVGEFGAYSAAPEAAKLRYLRLMRQAMAERGMPWYYWELAANFGVYDPVAHAFRAPIKQALFEH
jgi:endoglucanase